MLHKPEEWHFLSHHLRKRRNSIELFLSTHSKCYQDNNLPQIDSLNLPGINNQFVGGLYGIKHVSAGNPSDSWSADCSKRAVQIPQDQVDAVPALSDLWSVVACPYRTYAQTL